MNDKPSNGPGWAPLLSTLVLGLVYVPFAYGLAARMAMPAPPWPAVPSDTQLSVFGGMALAFLAGGQWGQAVTRGQTLSRTYLAAPLIAGLGVVAAFVERDMALALLCVGFGAQGAWDVMSAYAGRWPNRLIGERRVFTFAICLTLLGLLFVGPT